MKYMRFSTVSEFYSRAEPFLLRREAEHNLMLGICTMLMHDPARAQEPPYLATVERDGEVVLAALRTPPRSLVLSYAAEPEAGDVLADRLHAEGEALPGVIGSVPFSRAFTERWHRISGQAYRLALAERIYQLDRVNPVEGVPGRMHRANEGHRTLLLEWLAAFNAEALDETDTSGLERMVDRFLNADPRIQGMYIWENEQGRPVSMAGYSRPTPNGICVLAVYTPPEHRRRGYASACVAALSQWLLEGGRKYCFLYTDLANPTSNHIYQQIGYRPVCDAEEYRFINPEAAGVSPA
jgi:predicted GNAT family acetyltransferase